MNYQLFLKGECKKMPEQIIDYVFNDVADIVKDDYKEDKNYFPITNGVNDYLTRNNLSVTVINGILYDVLLDEYLNYVNYGI